MTEQDMETPQAAQRMKLAKEREERIKNQETLLAWVEVMPEPRNNKGGKVLFKTINSSGNGTSVYVGREIACAAYLSEMKREGKLGVPDERKIEMARQTAAKRREEQAKAKK